MVWTRCGIRIIPDPLKLAVSMAIGIIALPICVGTNIIRVIRCGTVIFRTEESENMAR
jgi:hypothetical protein